MNRYGIRPECKNVSARFVCICRRSRASSEDSSGGRDYDRRELEDWAAEESFFKVEGHHAFTNEKGGAGCSYLVSILNKFYCRITMLNVYPRVVHHMLIEYDHLESCGRLSTATSTSLLQTSRALLRGLKLHYHHLSSNDQGQPFNADGAEGDWKYVLENIRHAAVQVHEYFYPECPAQGDLTACLSSWDIRSTAVRIQGRGLTSVKWGSKHTFSIHLPQRFPSSPIMQYGPITHLDILVSLSSDNGKVTIPIPVTRRETITAPGEYHLLIYEYVYTTNIRGYYMLNGLKGTQCTCTIEVRWNGIHIGGSPFRCVPT